MKSCKKPKFLLGLVLTCAMAVSMLPSGIIGHASPTVILPEDFTVIEDFNTLDSWVCGNVGTDGEGAKASLESNIAFEGTSAKVEYDKDKADWSWPLFERAQAVGSFDVAAGTTGIAVWVHSTSGGTLRIKSWSNCYLEGSEEKQWKEIYCEKTIAAGEQVVLFPYADFVCGDDKVKVTSLDTFGYQMGFTMKGLSEGTGTLYFDKLGSYTDGGNLPVDPDIPDDPDDFEPPADFRPTVTLPKTFSLIEEFTSLEKWRVGNAGDNGEGIKVALDGAVAFEGTAAKVVYNKEKAKWNWPLFERKDEVGSIAVQPGSDGIVVWIYSSSAGTLRLKNWSNCYLEGSEEKQWKEIYCEAEITKGEQLVKFLYSDFVYGDDKTPVTGIETVGWNLGFAFARLEDAAGTMYIDKLGFFNSQDITLWDTLPELGEDEETKRVGITDTRFWINQWNSGDEYAASSSILSLDRTDPRYKMFQKEWTFTVDHANSYYASDPALLFWLSAEKTDLTNYLKTGTLRFWIKVPRSMKLKVSLEDSDYHKATAEFEAKVTEENEGYYEVQIPLSDFYFSNEAAGTAWDYTDILKITLAASDFSEEGFLQESESLSVSLFELWSKEAAEPQEVDISRYYDCGNGNGVMLRDTNEVMALTTVVAAFRNTLEMNIAEKVVGNYYLDGRVVDYYNINAMADTDSYNKIITAYEDVEILLPLTETLDESGLRAAVIENGRMTDIPLTVEGDYLVLTGTSFGDVVFYTGSQKKTNPVNPDNSNTNTPPTGEQNPFLPVSFAALGVSLGAMYWSQRHFGKKGRKAE